MSTALIFAFGVLVTSLVAGGFFYTVYCFHRVEAEARRGYGEHIAARGSARGRIGDDDPWAFGKAKSR